MRFILPKRPPDVASVVLGFNYDAHNATNFDFDFQPQSPSQHVDLSCWVKIGWGWSSLKTYDPRYEDTAFSDQQPTEHVVPRTSNTFDDTSFAAAGPRM